MKLGASKSSGEEMTGLEIGGESCPDASPGLQQGRAADRRAPRELLPCARPLVAPKLILVVALVLHARSAVACAAEVVVR